MNEAVALDLLRDAGLASEDALATRFSVNGGDAALRLTITNLDTTWMEIEFPDAGADSVLYKADADGSWEWQGEDADYSASFPVEAGDENYEPLVQLLDLVNNGTAAEIAEQLPKLLDIDPFAAYQAFENLIDNFDDIDGPGNNSYLFWDSAAQRFTVVAWDHNTAFGSTPGQGGGGQRGQAGQGGPGDGSADAAGGRGGPGGRGGANPLVKAFAADEGWAKLLTEKQAELKKSFYTSGELDDTVAQWSDLLTKDASDLVAPDVVASEAKTIEAYAD